MISNNNISLIKPPIDSLQSTGNRLVNVHFDITKSWTTNTQNNPDGWRVIISEVSTVSYYIYSLIYITNPLLQLKEHYLQFINHEANSLIRHTTLYIQGVLISFLFGRRTLPLPLHKVRALAGGTPNTQHSCHPAMTQVHM
jgi:hypothetical protein